MSVEAVYSSPADDDAAVVIGYVHDDGATAVMLSPSVANDSIGLTLNIHWSPAQARRVAAMLVAAADATEAGTVPEPDIDNADVGMVTE